MKIAWWVWESLLNPQGDSLEILLNGSTYWKLALRYSTEVWWSSLFKDYLTLRIFANAINLNLMDYNEKMKITLLLKGNSSGSC